MSALDRTGPAPETRSSRFGLLLFGASAAPLFWLGQIMLGYGVTAYVCFPGDHPQMLANALLLHIAVVAFDVVAIAGAAGGGWIAFRCWRHAEDGAGRFLAVWGIFSTLCFLSGIVFNSIASLMVPPCLI